MTFQRFTILASLACAAFAPSAAAQDAETFGTSDPMPVRAPKAAPTPLSTRFGFELPQDLPAYWLPAIDESAVFQEDGLDATLSFTKTVRYGLGRDLLFRMDDGVWHDLGDGRWLWTADLVSNGAIGVRLSIVDMELPEGAELVVYAPRDPSNIAGPYTGTGPFEDGHVWTPTRAGERVRVEYLVRAAEGETVPSTPPFRIDRLQHVYRDPWKLGAGEEGAGSCHNDVTCYSSLNNLKQACAGIGTINVNSLFCSGQMLNTLASDLTPYFITANHCLSTSTEAQNSEIYWDYQTSSCNGAPPTLASVPSSPVCTLLSTSASSDYTLLMIEGTLPSNRFWAGWLSSAQLTGTAGLCVHHPGGSYKRVSFGIYSATQECSTSGHFRVNWTNGPTEPGSSGSGFFRTDTQQFVGQLHCGPSSCSSESYDGYGRFADTYNTGSVASLLAVGSDDASEPNDTCGGNPDLAVGTYSGRIVKSTDDDWYETLVPEGAQLTVSLSFTHANGDIDAKLWVNCGDSSYTDVSAGVSNSEQLVWVNDTGAANTVAWQVYLYNDTRNRYTMTVSLTPANDTCANAISIGEGATLEGSTVNATNSITGLCGLSGASADVWYEYVANQTGILQIHTAGSQLDTVLSVYDACFGSELGCNDDAPEGAPIANTTLQSYLAVPVVSGQNYFIRVAGYNGLEGAFRIRCDTDSGAPFCLGDGLSSLDCPCNNESLTVLQGGCENSTGNPGVLVASGVADVNGDTILLSASGMPGSSTCLYFQGSAKQAGGTGVIFGDGLRCAGGTVIRLDTKTNSVVGTSAYPVGSDPRVSVRGLVPAGGGSRYYQVWYRNSVFFCSTSTYNLTNGYELHWQP